MKKPAKILTIISVIIVVVCILCVVAIIASDNFTKENKQTGTKIDVDIAKNKSTLKADRLNCKDAKKEIILDCKWGNAEEQLKMSKYQEAKDTPVSYEVPSSFTVDSDGNVYVADTLSKKLKVFKNNLLVRSIIFPSGNSPFILRDMNVDTEGNIFGINYLANEAVKIDKDNKINKVFTLEGSAKLNRPETISILSSGNIMIQDNVDSENATRVRKFDKDGSVVSEKKMANIIDFNLYEYESQDGSIISISPIGIKNHQIEIKDKKDGTRKGICNFSTLPISKDTECNTKLLGSDKNGQLYFWLQDTPSNEKRNELGIDAFLKQCREYVCRIDAISNKVDIIKLDNTDKSMANSTANLSNLFIKADNNGNVYQLMMNEQGYKIIKYSF